MKAKRAALIEALTGRFDDHHAELARMLLDQIDAAHRPDRQAHHPHRGTDRSDPRRPGRRRRRHHRPRRRPGRGRRGAARHRPPGRDHRHRPGGRPGHHRRDRPGHEQVPHRRPPGVLGQALPRAPSSPGPPAAAGRTGKGNPYLKGVLGEAAAAAARTDTFLGERYRRIVKRRGKLKALVAVARSILVIIWHLLADPTARYHDLGSGLPRQPHRQGPQSPQPHPPARGPRIHRHPHPSRRLRYQRGLRGRLTETGAAA